MTLEEIMDLYFEVNNYLKVIAENRKGKNGK